MTPFKALYGRDPPTLVRYQPEITDVPTVQEQLTARDKLLRQLKDNLMKAQTYTKNQADKKRQDVNLQVGDLVLVKLQPYKQHSAALRKNHKLGMRFFGPLKFWPEQEQWPTSQSYLQKLKYTMSSILSAEVV